MRNNCLDFEYKQDSVTKVETEQKPSIVKTRKNLSNICRNNFGNILIAMVK